MTHHNILKRNSFSITATGRMMDLSKTRRLGICLRIAQLLNMQTNKLYSRISESKYYKTLGKVIMHVYSPTGRQDRESLTLW